VLERASTLGVPALIARYNLAQCQGLLLVARGLEVVIADADTGLRRRLLKALRFRRLLAEVAGDDQGELRLRVSGPASVLDQASRYGLQLALWLPALACARDWRASAEIDLPRRAGAPGGRARLELSHDLGLEGDSAFLGHVPEELADLQRTLAEKLPAWTWQDAQLLPLPGGELVVPDLQLAAAGGTVAIEFFHRWHGHALRRRLDQLAGGLAPRLAIGVDRALARTREIAPLLEHPAFLAHGFLFSDIPAPRAIAEVVARLLPAAGGTSRAPTP
jgi:predicted nuclease of restriction endonuclease-like RecB superfamily